MFWKTKWDVFKILRCVAHHQYDGLTQCTCGDGNPPEEGACESKDDCIEVVSSGPPCSELLENRAEAHVEKEKQHDEKYAEYLKKLDEKEKNSKSEIKKPHKTAMGQQHKSMDQVNA